MDMPAQRKVEALAMQRGQTKLSGPRPDSSRLEDPWVRKALHHNQQLGNSESETPRFDYWSKNGSCFFFLTLGEDLTFWTEKKMSYNYYLDKDFFGKNPDTLLSLPLRIPSVGPVVYKGEYPSEDNVYPINLP